MTYTYTNQLISKKGTQNIIWVCDFARKEVGWGIKQ